MIFVTVGTEKFPFDRLLKIIEEAIERGDIKEEVFAQIGNTRYRPRSFGYMNFLNFDVQVKFIKEADIVISHAGEGSLILALSLGKIPIVFPRRAAFKEHFDDHQVDAAGKMERRGGALVAYTEEELLDKIMNYKRYAKELKPFHGGESRQDLVNHLREICG